jgi:hypothetical protein
MTTTRWNHPISVDRMATSSNPDFARLSVDVGQTGFFEGREFRWVRKLSLSSGVTQWFKFNCPVPFILYEQAIKATQGHFEFYAYRAADVSVTTPFEGDALPSFGKNSSPEREVVEGGGFYVQQSTIRGGGALTLVNADNYADFDEVKTSGNANQSTSVGGSENSQRYLPAGDYYLGFVPVGGAAIGSWRLVIGERP